MASLIESNPLVSVVMPTYNNAPLIAETINSVRAQTYKNLEIIVIDDGSTDDTEAVVNQIASVDSRVHYIKIKNSYSPTARNVGFNSANGDYVATIDSDDLWPSDKITVQLQALNENPDAVIVGSVQRFTEDTDKEKAFGAISFPPSKEGDYVHNLLSVEHQQMVNLNTLCAKRSIICEDGLWDPEFHTAHDWEVWVRLAKKHPFIHMDKVLQHYRKHRASVTGHEKWQTALKYQLQVVDHHAPRGLAKLWKKLTYRRLRYQCYVGILTYENQLWAAFKLWVHAAFRSNMLFSKVGIRLLAEMTLKAIKQKLASSKAENV